MGCETAFSRKKIGRWSLVFAMVVALLSAMAFSLSGALALPAYADDASITYAQADGYEPYQGWQDSPWDEASDPWYSSSGGTTRKGYPAWSLTDPLSKGVTGYNGGAVTGSSLTVLTDMNKTNTSTLGTYDSPYYYKNIILPSYDANASELQFTLTYVGAGGVNPAYLFDGHGGLLVTKSDDPATWSDPANVVWEGNTSNVSVINTSDNWWKNIVCTVDASKIDPNETYYFVIKNGTAGQWARLYANIVFEFNTYTDKTLSWEGDETQAGYGREQGNGGTKLGIMDPSASEVTTDLSKVAYCWHNQLSSSLVLGDGGNATMTIHADGSGSNWQGLSTWTGMCAGQVNVYDSDPTAGGAYDVASLTPVASASAGTLGFSLVNTSRDWPSYDGVNVTMSGLESGKTYYLVFGPDLQPQTTSSLGKPIIFEFTTAAVVKSWDIGKDVETDAQATLYSDGQFVISGTGDLKSYDLSARPPWAVSPSAFQDYRSTIKTVRFEGVSPTDLSAYFANCSNLKKVSSLPESVEKMTATFQYCSSLEQAPVIPDNVKVLNGSFAWCSSLKEAPVIPDNAENIAGMLKYCPQITQSPVIPSGVLYSFGLFCGCSALLEAPAIPEGVTDIEDMFNGCSSLKAMPDIPQGVTNMSHAFQDCKLLKTITNLPDSVENMAYTFYGCTALEAVPALPSNVKTITYLFSGCSSLKVAPEIPESVEISMFSTFQNCAALETGPSKIPSGVTNMWRAFQNCRSLKQAPELSSGLENMKETFQNCTTLTKAPVIPDTVTNMQGTFQNCSGITEAPLIPGKVITLSNTFSGCTALVRLPADFSIPASVTNKTNTFKVLTPYSATNLLDTYTESKDASLAAYNWTGSFRNLIVQDFAALSAAIDEAQAEASSGIVVSADGKDVANGSSYVSADDMTAYTKAIADAKAVADNSTATQDEIDGAVSALAQAKTTFKAAIKVAAISVDNLSASVQAAVDLKDSVVVSVDGSDVPAGKDWATQAQVDDLAAAITAAQGMVNKTDATQNDVDAAKVKIDAAQAAFKKNTAEPSVVALAASLADAGTAEESATVSVDGRDVAHGQTWCTQADLDLLKAAAASAQEVLDAVNQAMGGTRAVTPETVTQNDVDAAVANLNAATEVFKSALKTAEVDTTSLEASIASANENIKSVVVSKDGTDVLTTKQWVKQEQVDALQAALVTARSAATAAARTQNDVDAAVSDLDAAVATFDQAKQAGLVADTAALKSLIDQVEESTADVMVAEDASQVQQGTVFVTQASKDALQAVLDEARALADDADATQTAVDAMQTKLTNALSAFEAAKQAGTKTDAGDGSQVGGSPSGNQPGAGSSAGGSMGASTGGSGTTLVATGDPLVLVTPIALIAAAIAAFTVIAVRRKMRD